MGNYKFIDSARFISEVSVSVKSNDELFTNEIAEEMNNFWSGASDRLDIANGDIKRAALLMVAVVLIGLTIEHDGNVYLIQREFDQSEGFPGPGYFTVTDVDGLDSLEYEDVEIEESP